MSRLGRSQPIQPFSAHGFVDPGPGPVGTVPPRATVVENDDRRRRGPALPSIILTGPAPTGVAPTVTPPAPVCVIQGDRRRATPDAVAISAALLSVTQAPPTVVPPSPLFVIQADRRRALLDPVALSAALLSVIQAPPPVLPTGPFVVPLEERRRLFAALPPTIIHGAIGGVPAAPVAPVDPLDRPVNRGGWRRHPKHIQDEEEIVALLATILD